MINNVERLELRRFRVNVVKFIKDRLEKGIEVYPVLLNYMETLEKKKRKK
jgi:hypothetical protein